MKFWLATATSILWAAGYAVACWIWPFRRCTGCDGTGRKPSPSGRAFRLCRKCKGNARQLRLGRRIWAYLRRAHADL